MEYKDINYNGCADIYSTHRNASERAIKHIIENLQNKEISTMLEIGCGTADHLYELRKHFHNNAFGFDKSIKMLNEGNIKNPGLELKNFDAMNKFEYQNNFFDFAFSINVIHYISNLQHYFNETYRVLKDNGIVLTISASNEEMKKDLQKYFPEFGQNSVRSDLMFEEIKKAMKYAGFRDINTTYTNYAFNIDENFLMSIENKACAWTKLLSNECFESGFKQMREDVKNCDCKGNEYFVYIWGSK